MGSAGSGEQYDARPSVSVVHDAGSSPAYGEQRDADAERRDGAAGQRDAAAARRDDDADERDVDAGHRDALAEQRDDDADERDVEREQRDTAADRRDDESDGRDADAGQRDIDAGYRDVDAHDRDVEGAQRDGDGHRRDTAADRRDSSAARRDRAADQRDRAADLRDRGEGPATGSMLPAQPDHGRQQAAADRQLAREDRIAAAIERSGAAADRATAQADRVASADGRGLSGLERHTALADRGTALADRVVAAKGRDLSGVERQLALADRVSGASGRDFSGADRGIALADREAGASGRGSAGRDRGATLDDWAASALDRHSAAEFIAGELRMVESGAHAWQVLHAIGDPVVVVGPGVIVELVNARTVKMFGYQADELVGQPIERLVPAGLNDVYRRHLAAAVPSDLRMATADQRLVAVRKNGTLLPIEVNLSAIHLSSGPAVLIAVRDAGDLEPALAEPPISDDPDRASFDAAHRKTEAELQERVADLEHAVQAARVDAHRAKAARGAFLSRMSHELRTPLNAILGFGQLLALDDLTDDNRASVDDILRAGHHLLGLVDEVLGITTPTNGSNRGLFRGAPPVIEQPGETGLTPVPRRPPVSGGYRTVLYVEDNPANVHLFEQVMARRPGVELVVARRGRVGLDMALTHRPDLILLDLHLPDMSGAAVLDRLRASPLTATTPIVMLSADATPGQAERLIAAGATSYLTKPIRVHRLLAIIDGTDAAAPAGLMSTPATRPVAVGPPGAAITPAPGRGQDGPAASGTTDVVHDLINLLGAVLTYCDLLDGNQSAASNSRWLGQQRIATEPAIGMIKQFGGASTPTG